MSTALTIRNDMDIQTLGTTLAKSGYFQDSRDAAQAIVKVLAGAEIGISPIASMTGINIISGRVALSANLIASVIKRAKPRYNYKVLTFTADECSIEFFEDGQSAGVSTFTKEDARKAGTKNMDKFPRNMLFARAISNGAKWYAAELFGGGAVYTPDELGAEIDGDTGEVLHAPTITVLPQADPKRDKMIARIRTLADEYLHLTGEDWLSADDDHLREVSTDELVAAGKNLAQLLETVKADIAAKEEVGQLDPEVTPESEAVLFKNTELAHERQIKMIQRMAKERGIDADAELGDIWREVMTADEAGTTITEWMKRPTLTETVVV
jgi:hypothetical protein